MPRVFFHGSAAALLLLAACSPIRTETMSVHAARHCLNNTEDFGHDGGGVRPGRDEPGGTNRAGICRFSQISPTVARSGCGRIRAKRHRGTAGGAHGRGGRDGSP